MIRVATVLVLVSVLSLALIVITFIPILIRFGFALHIGALLEESDSSQLIAWVLILALAPVLLMVGWQRFTREMSPGKRGLLCGLTLGLWALSCAIVLPYVGAYPVLWAFVPMIIFGWGSSGLEFWLSLYLVNLLVCPLAGLLFFRWMARWRQRLYSPLR